MNLQTIQTTEVVNLSTSQPSHTIISIKNWIISYLADLLEVDPEDIDPTIPFDRYGLDSSSAVGLTGDLEDWLGQELDPTLLYDYPTIEHLSQYLGSTLQQ